MTDSNGLPLLALRLNMSTEKSNGGYHSLKVGKFDHSSTTPRATRWRVTITGQNLTLYSIRVVTGPRHPSARSA